MKSLRELFRIGKGPSSSHTMVKAAERGIDAEGALPGPLGLSRKAVSYYVKAQV